MANLLMDRNLRPLRVMVVRIPLHIGGGLIHAVLVVAVILSVYNFGDKRQSNDLASSVTDKARAIGPMRTKIR